MKTTNCLLIMATAGFPWRESIQVSSSPSWPAGPDARSDSPIAKQRLLSPSEMFPLSPPAQSPRATDNSSLIPQMPDALPPQAPESPRDDGTGFSVYHVFQRLLLGNIPMPTRPAPASPRASNSSPIGTRHSCQQLQLFVYRLRSCLSRCSCNARSTASHCS